MRRSFTFVAVIAAVAPLLVVAQAAPANAAETLPTGFSDSVVATIASPTAIAFTRDDRILVTSQSGQLHVISAGTLLATPAIDLTASICSNSERGLLGVAVDPSFGKNHYVYLYYTHRSASGCPTATTDTPHNRVSRFVLDDSNVINPASEKILLDNMPSYAGNHNGGDLKFGNDGYLYTSIGDSGCDYQGNSGCGGDNDTSRDQFTLEGKILRITRTGGIPPTNPFLTATDDRCNLTGHTVPGHRCRETFAWGLRNPFRIAFDQNQPGAVFRIDDVGQDTWEEIDAGIAGTDYGWNVREGHCLEGSSSDCPPPGAGMTDPIFDYNHSTGCKTVAGGAFVPNGVWPKKWADHYLFADYGCGTIFDLVPNSGSSGYNAVPFATGMGTGGPIAMAFGKRAAGGKGTGVGLYYTTYASNGQVRIITR